MLSLGRHNIFNNIIITGSSGLIGRWVCDLLYEHGKNVLGLDIAPAPQERLPWNSVQCDILDKTNLMYIFNDFQPEAIVHLAARTDLEGKSLSDYKINIDGVKNICEVSRSTKSVSRAIFASTMLVCKVGYVPKSFEEYCPNTFYGESKVKTEKIVKQENGGDVTWCLTRPTTVWGPHMNEHYKRLIDYINNGRYFHSGGGKLFKSYGYAKNVAFQYIRLLFANAEDIHNQTFYIADYEPLSLRDYVNGIADKLDVKRPITIPLPLARIIALGGDFLNRIGLRFPYNTFRLQNIRTEYIFDLSKTKEVCGSLPVGFEEGLKETVQWYCRTS